MLLVFLIFTSEKSDLVGSPFSAVFCIYARTVPTAQRLCGVFSSGRMKCLMSIQVSSCRVGKLHAGARNTDKRHSLVVLFFGPYSTRICIGLVGTTMGDERSLSDEGIACEGWLNGVTILHLFQLHPSRVHVTKRTMEPTYHGDGVVDKLFLLCE